MQLIRRGRWAAIVSVVVVKEADMSSFLGFAEVTGAILAALGLALALEWIGLYGLTSLMPPRRNSSTQNIEKF
jgi:hypothetical protein